MRNLCLALLIVFPALAAGQGSRWKVMDSSYRLQETGAHLYFSDSNIGGAPGKAWCLIVPPDRKSFKWAVDTSAGRRLTPAEYSHRNDTPLAVINTTFFSFATSANLNLVVRKGKIVAHSVHTAILKGADSGLFVHYLRSAFGFRRSGRPDVTWVFTDSGRRKVYAWQEGPLTVPNGAGRATLSTFRNGQGTRPKKWKVRTAVGGGPVLIQKGQVQIFHNEERMFAGKAQHDRHPRTAIGYRADGSVVLLVVEGRQPGMAEGASLPQLAALLQDLGCIEAMNLDGGGSSCLLVRGLPTNYPSDGGNQRGVPAVLMVFQD